MLDQGELTDAEIEKSIYTGVDCCRDAKYPKQAIRVTPTSAVIKPGGNVQLLGYYITRECDPACFHWRIIKGGGTLSEEFGHATIFFAPFFVEECEGSAIVGLFCGGKLVDTCYIGVNEYTEDEFAYWKVGEWKDGYLYDHSQKTPTTTVPRVRYKDLDPKRSMIKLSGRRCNGSPKSIIYDGVLQKSLATNEHYILEQKWSGGGLYKWENYSLWAYEAGSFGAAKGRLLDALLRLVVFRYWPQYYMTKEQWAEYSASRRDWKLAPGTVLDVRTPKQLADKCCPPELI